jgi:hypothetical protein
LANFGRGPADDLYCSNADRRAGRQAAKLNPYLKQATERLQEVETKL